MKAKDTNPPPATNAQDDSLTREKAEMRKRMAQARKQAHLANPHAADALALHADRLMAWHGAARGEVVAGYIPIRTEIDPMPLMARLAASGMKTALPRTPPPGKPLAFHAWQEGDVLAEGDYGTREPQASAPECIPALILTPLLAFDSAGYRLGYGGGFYDRTLAMLRKDHPQIKAVGIAYPAQKMQSVPRGEYDLPLDAILTTDGLVVIQ